MTCTRHGNNLHPELPPCPTCGEWAWRTGGVTMGVHTSATYTCGSPECLGTAHALFCGLALAVIFERHPEEFDSIDIPPQLGDWLGSARRALRSANINECVHAGVEPPGSIVVPLPALSGCLYGWVAWERAARGDLVDLGQLFCARVARLREPALTKSGYDDEMFTNTSR